MAEKPQDEPMKEKSKETKKEEKKKKETKKEEKKKKEPSPETEPGQMRIRPWAEYTSYLTRIPPEDFSYKNPKIVDPKVQELIDKGIELMEADKNVEAIEVFTEAIKLDDKYALITINRAACYARLGNFIDALEDCETTCELRPDWPQAYLRKGTVLLELFRHRFAHSAFKRGYEREPTNMKLERGQYEALVRLQRRGKKKPWPNVVVTALSDKSVQHILFRDPKSRHLMIEPDFYEIIEKIRHDPKEIRQHMLKDDYKVAMCVAVASGSDVNDSEVDYEDMAFPVEAREKKEKYAKIPWQYEYNPIKEVFVPPTPPPKRKERYPFPFFELEMEKEMGLMRSHRLTNYELDFDYMDRKKFY
ncbi:uncharacterized protein LOC127000922 isoform X2 [Eriocheir sinensis]|nr:uncharacterized protein LOC127000922 isoform X2 [Eriocheir sinensis]XP_050721024.1 uncharacterized protein LOC127000922 isoform X2 [Eriocheir sinensis]XP_050721025.1 uncharacterized protein LOC127000922 isoform X2 [Eriocheir sinensis]XP_050721026.1 uncharacterized protein LOC127000922 isoform X2 [Eriocheir sinensis]XP_050721027.1 uncharacterized protein LOC127000922 isoform X2 [Eriocheir sinensis]XP_050721028.1 uncharacterized protein LOC127000922 isoform X2 [Eriocheir sinensis]